VGEEVAGQGHDDGDAGLVVGAEERGAAGGDDVVALAGGEVGGGVRREVEVRGVGEGNGAAVVCAVDDGLDAGGVELRRGVSTCARNATVGAGVVAGMVARTVP
jgi:hypothetical protein